MLQAANPPQWVPEKPSVKAEIIPEYKEGEKIDWHNYTAIALELQRTGENGLHIFSSVIH